MRKGMLFFLITTLALVYSIHIYAGGGDETIVQRSPITNIGTNDIVGLCEVFRDEDGVSFELHSISSLGAGNAFTAWARIDDDLDGVFEINFLVDGAISGAGGTDGGGEATFEGRIARDDIPPADGETVLVNDGDGEFDEPLTAALNFIIRTHGSIIPGMFIDQVSRLTGGCGINPCSNIQSSSIESPGDLDD